MKFASNPAAFAALCALVGLGCGDPAATPARPDAMADVTAPDAMADVTAPDAVADVTAPDAVADLTAPDATMPTVGPYPAGPYGTREGQTLANLDWEGYTNLDGAELSTAQPFAPTSLQAVRETGRAYALVHVSEFF
jgi:hypothetical protein